jgi:hypothetical protein
MFENRRSESVALNWRGPLLAAGIFAAAFAILLLMAHQNESKTSDMGSSLREDPYGTSLLFDSYQRAGYEVKRSQDQDSLSEQNALKTTAFFVGGYSDDDWRMEKGKLHIGDKLRGRMEKFLASGGRVVLISPRSEFKSESQGWEVKNKWDPKGRGSGPSWLSPDVGSLPAETEKIYLASDSPWLETDPGWTVLYAKPADAKADADAPVHVYMAMRKVGNGELIAASQESFLLNEAIKTRPNPVLLDFLTAGRPVVWVDETLHGLHQEQGVLWLVQRYRLQTALLLCWATLLAVLWSMRGDLVRRPASDQGLQIMRQGEGPGVAARRLLQRSVAKEQVVAECWEQFRRRSPQDADAISADPQWGPRLRTAIAQPPLAGYRELSRLIAERRASAKGLGGTDREPRDSSTVLWKTGSGEERTT